MSNQALILILAVVTLLLALWRTGALNPARIQIILWLTLYLVLIYGILQYFPVTIRFSNGL